jgi:hypothetical protein
MFTPINRSAFFWDNAVFLHDCQYTRLSFFYVYKNGKPIYKKKTPRFQKLEKCDR